MTDKQRIDKLEKQVALLKRIISELTAQDDKPLPFTSEPKA